MKPIRREAITALMAAPLILPEAARSAPTCPNSKIPKTNWATSAEGQRKADLGNGTYLNLIWPATRVGGIGHRGIQWNLDLC